MLVQRFRSKPIASEEEEEEEAEEEDTSGSK
jgi:hypothetical protein